MSKIIIFLGFESELHPFSFVVGSRRPVGTERRLPEPYPRQGQRPEPRGGACVRGAWGQARSGTSRSGRDPLDPDPRSQDVVDLGACPSPRRLTPRTFLRSGRFSRSPLPSSADAHLRPPSTPFHTSPSPPPSGLDAEAAVFYEARSSVSLRRPVSPTSRSPSSPSGCRRRLAGFFPPPPRARRV